MNWYCKLTAISVLVTFTLAGCGGGSGSAGTPVTGVTTSTGGGSGSTTSATLVTSVPPATYTANSANATIYQELNTLRSGIGSGLLTQNAALDQSSVAHLQYLQKNGIADPSFHIETQGQTGFTGADPSTRAAAAGYTASLIGEVGYAALVANGNLASVNSWSDSVYHIVAILGNQRDVGVACSDAPLPDNTTGQPVTQSICVSDFGIQSTAQGQLPTSGTVLAYPYNNQTNVPTGFKNQSESPIPAPDLDGVGQPIVVNLNDTVSDVKTFTITTAAGAAVQARIMVASASVTGNGLTVDANMASEGMSGFVVLLPTSTLQPNTQYNVSFAAVGTTFSGAYTKTWSFTTGSLTSY